MNNFCQKSGENLYSLLLREVCPGVNHQLVHVSKKQPLSCAYILIYSTLNVVFIHSSIVRFQSWSKIEFIYLFMYVYLKKIKSNYGKLYWHCE